MDFKKKDLNKTDFKREFIDFMVRAGALTFGDFITKSGRPTPYFINTGNYNSGVQAARLGEFYAKCINDAVSRGVLSDNIDVLFGPAYKGIPLVVSTSIAMATTFGRDYPYAFNRKEEKDHGEGGSLIGYKPKDGDRMLIIEDVITAGTAVRETIPVLRAAADVKIEGIIISVDRMEKGQSDMTAIDEIEAEFGIKTCSIVNVREIIESLHNREIDGKIVIDDEVRAKMEKHLSTVTQNSFEKV